MAKTYERGSPGFYSVRQVADQLAVHPETVRRLIHGGDLDAVRVGRLLRVASESVDAFLAGRHVQANNRGRAPR